MKTPPKFGSYKDSPTKEKRKRLEELAEGKQNQRRRLA
jgi:hypothetical protein